MSRDYERQPFAVAAFITRVETDVDLGKVAEPRNAGTAKKSSWTSETR